MAWKWRSQKVFGEFDNRIRLVIRKIHCKSGTACGLCSPITQLMFHLTSKVLFPVFLYILLYCEMSDNKSPLDLESIMSSPRINYEKERISISMDWDSKNFRLYNFKNFDWKNHFDFGVRNKIEISICYSCEL